MAENQTARVVLNAEEWEKRMVTEVAVKERFIVDAQGTKMAVILSLEAYEQILEDLHDLAVVAERRDEETISFDGVKERLKENDLL